ncbi:MAG TPA: hypothetical protein VNX65_05275 [Patescibacteria group bacterium]|jgi:hypothetical protein|nr:hypothetical protein [Patescibacteria group bacterium]
MTEAKFRQILSEALIAQDKRFDKKFDEKFDERFDRRLKQSLDSEFAKFFGHIARLFESNKEEILAEVSIKIDRLIVTIDGIADRTLTYEQEQTAIAHIQNRHTLWIKQLATTTKTKLAPEM